MAKSATIRTGPTEAEFTRQVIEFAQLHRWHAMHQRPGLTRSGKWVTATQGNGVGWPDLVLVRERIVFAELKTDRGVVSEAQLEWFAWLKNAGAEVYIFRPRDWDEIESVLTR